jgi:hypothetical protein
MLSAAHGLQDSSICCTSSGSVQVDTRKCTYVRDMPQPAHTMSAPMKCTVTVESKVKPLMLMCGFNTLNDYMQSSSHDPPVPA